MNTKISYERYQRQLPLKNFGEAAQQKLHQAKVMVVGAGGLGCPALQYLSAIGVGNIGIMDGDIVSLSNLHRQILFDTNDVGKLKVDVVLQKLQRQNPETILTIYPEFLTQQNAFSVLTEYDLVIDCTDNFKARYMINDACVLLQKPVVFGAVFQYEGQVAVFNLNKNSANYRDLFPTAPGIHEAPTCENAGAFNIVTGIIGTLQACEVIKIITGIGEVLDNALLTYQSLSSSFYKIELERNSKHHLSTPINEQAFKEFDYELFCNLHTNQAAELSAEEFDNLLHADNIQLVDIRNEGELPVVTAFDSLKIPLPVLQENLHLLDKQKKIVLFCHTGVRTQIAMEMLEEQFHFENVSHLKGGIVKWLHYKENLI